MKEKRRITRNLWRLTENLLSSEFNLGIFLSFSLGKSVKMKMKKKKKTDLGMKTFINLKFTVYHKIMSWFKLFNMKLVKSGFY